MIDLSSLAKFTDAYPNAAAPLSHELHHDPLMTIPRLAVLIPTLPRRLVTITRDTANADTPPPPPELILQGIEGLNAELAVAEAETDPTYADLIALVVRPLRPLTAAGKAPIGDLESSIVIASADRTLAHPAPFQHALILQCRGEQQVRASGPSPDEPAQEFTLAEGDAVYIPQSRSREARTISTSVSLQVSWNEREAHDGAGPLQRLINAFKRR